MSLDNLKTILNAIKYLLTDYPKKKDIPTKLPNPNPLNFTGAVKGSYDGSEATNIKIPEQVQTDWNQNDSTEADYIKNKPSTATNDDSMDFLAEMGMITPVTNSTGEILISPSNEIYSL